MDWTKEYCDMQYLGKFSTIKTWVSVQRFTHSAELAVYFPGCQFSPNCQTYPTVEEAKTVGEKIMKHKGFMV